MQAAIESSPVEYSGPHPWQTAGWARRVRRACFRRAYLRWAEQAVTELTVTGLDRLEAVDGPAIIICNHSSHLDTPVLMAALPAAVRDTLYFGAAADRWFVKGKKKLELQPWYQSLVLGNFPIVRGGGSKTLDYARWLLDGGHKICVFPEGTRATGDALGRFRAGVPLLALEKGVPVVPIYLGGLRELRPKGQREVRPGPASVEILEPVRFAADTPVDAAIDLLWRRMNAVHVQHRLLAGTAPTRTEAVPDATVLATNDAVRADHSVAA